MIPYRIPIILSNALGEAFIVLKKKINIIKLLCFFLISISLFGCSAANKDGYQAGNEPSVETAFLMGTIVKVSIYDQIEDKTIFQKVFNRIAEIEAKMTINTATEQSEIISLNNAAGRELCKLSADTFYVLEKGKYFSELSGGLFDITIGPLVKLWNIGTEAATVPQETEILNKLPLVNYQNLILDKDQQTAKLSAPGMIVDLGAIAKGYGADEAAKILLENGIKHAIINLGGNILALNSRPDGSAWRLGLQDPYEPRGEYMGIVTLKNQTLVSSGTYERYLERNGKRYHHILNPQTGYPEDNGLVSVSIITARSIDADALSTTIFLLGLEKGLALVEKLPDTEAIFITADKKVYTSSGVSATNFEIKKNEYQLQKR
jgi:thiamine biosynthesis lipoprotein